MATPTLRALRKLAGPDGQVVGIMRRYVSDVLAGTSLLDDAILYEKSERWLSLPKREVIRKLKDTQFDCVVLLTNSMRTAWMARRSGARERIGYRNEARSWLLTKAISQPVVSPGVSIPAVDSYLHLAYAAGCSPEPATLELGTEENNERAAEAVWQKLGLPSGDRVIVLNSGGAYGAAKLWPAEHFAELARRLVADGVFSVLVNCGPAEREVARSITRQASDSRIVSLAECEELPVGLTKACIRRSRLLVTTDSGPRYIGVAFNRPVVTLFGPTDPRFTKLPYEREVSLSLALDCQPCMERTCPLRHHRCMRELSVDRVYAAVQESLNRVTAEFAA